MTCHPGYTQEHRVFLLLHLNVIAALIAARHAAKSVRVVSILTCLNTVAYHTLMGEFCASSIFETVNWAALKFRFLVDLLPFILWLDFMAAWFIIKGKSSLKLEDGAKWLCA